jgi:hypothetical protein
MNAPGRLSILYEWAASGLLMLGNEISAAALLHIAATVQHRSPAHSLTSRRTTARTELE